MPANEDDLDGLRSEGDLNISRERDALYRALPRGLSFKVTMGNLLTLTPPLTITREEMTAAMDILDASLALEKQ